MHQVGRPCLQSSQKYGTKIIIDLLRSGGPALTLGRQQRRATRPPLPPALLQWALLQWVASASQLRLSAGHAIQRQRACAGQALQHALLAADRPQPLALAQPVSAGTFRHPFRLATNGGATRPASRSDRADNVR